MPYADRESQAVQIRTFVVLPAPSSCPRAACTFIPARTLALSAQSLAAVWGGQCHHRGVRLSEKYFVLPARGGGAKQPGHPASNRSLMLGGSSPCSRRRAGHGQGRVGSSPRDGQGAGSTRPSPQPAPGLVPLGRRWRTEPGGRGLIWGGGWGGTGTGRNSLLCVAEVVAEV